MNKPPVQGPGLPFTISWHTMVQYDSESIFIIGGKQDGHTTPSNRTMIGKTIYLISFVMSDYILFNWNLNNSAYYLPK